MSFNENPKIDLYSETSEESVNETRKYFTQRNNFLTREENPDKGVDLDIELLANGSTTGFKFALQIKSEQTTRTINRDNIKYIKYSFATSRLGYLCRRTPGFGLIVLYDDNKKVLYYDYVENIYNTISKYKKNDDWKEQDNVTIYIDDKNVLDVNSISHIYTIMHQRFTNFNKMYQQTAKDYDLPIFEFYKICNPIEILEKYGYIFFNKQEYNTLFIIIQKLQLNEIIENPKILLLAALTYSEIGLFIDANYFYKKCYEHVSEYTNEEKEILKLTELSTKYNLGEICKDTYRNELSNLKDETTNILYLIHIRLKIIFFDILKASDDDDYTKLILDEIDCMRNDLNNIDISEELRNYYLLEIASFLFQMGNLKYIREVAHITIKRKILGEPILAETILKAQTLSSLILEPKLMAQKVYKYAEESNNIHLKAIVLYKMCLFFITFEMRNLISSLKDNNSFALFEKPQSKDFFSETLNYALTAYNIFNEESHFENAYNSLAIANEINYMFSVIFSKNIDDGKIAIIKHNLEVLEKQLSKNEYECIAEKTVNECLEKEEGFKDIDSKGITSFAKTLIKSLEIPADRIENIIFDINFLKESEKKVQEKYFDLLQNLLHTKSKDTLYKEKPRYVIRCKKCKYQTYEGSDLDSLLSQLNIEHKHICF